MKIKLLSAPFIAALLTSLIKPFLCLQTNAARWTGVFLIYDIRLDLTTEAEYTAEERNSSELMDQSADFLLD